MSKSKIFSIQKLFLDFLVEQQLWEQAAAGWPRRWAQAKGPLGAAMLSLRCLGWSWPEPFRVVTDSGATMSLTEFLPKAVEDAVRCAGRRRAERAFAAHLRKRGDYVGDSGGEVEERACLAELLG